MSVAGIRMLQRYGLPQTPPALALPQTIAGLRVWLDASDASTITHSSGTVSQWTSKDANARTFSPPAGLEPTTGASTVNGLNVLDYAGDALVSDDLASVWTFLHDGTHYEVFAVVKFGTGSNPEALYPLFGTSVIASSEVGMNVFYDDRPVAGNNLLRVFSGNGSDIVITSDAASVTPNTTALVEGRFDPDNATAADRSTIKVNDGTAAQDNNRTNAPSASAPPGPLTIGADGNRDFALTGQFMEFIVYENTLTTTERSDLRTDLASKWGVTI